MSPRIQTRSAPSLRPSCAQFLEDTLAARLLTSYVELSVGYESGVSLAPANGAASGSRGAGRQPSHNWTIPAHH